MPPPPPRSRVAALGPLLAVVGAGLAGAVAPPIRAEGPPAPQYMCIVNGIDDFTRDFSPPAPADSRMACSGSIHYTLLRTPAEITAEMNAVLDGAEATGYPVFVNLDDWNFPRGEWAGDPAIVEWTAWDGTLATFREIEWRADNPQNPPPNFESPQYRAAVGPVFDAAFRALATRLARWTAEGRAHLFAGVAVGWESGYYTEFRSLVRDERSEEGSIVAGDRSVTFRLPSSWSRRTRSTIRHTLYLARIARLSAP